MKVKSPRSELVRHLQMVTRATASRAAVQTLMGVMVKASESKLDLAATDAEIAIQTQLDADVEQPGAALIPGRLLVDILRVLDGDEVDLEYAQDKRELYVSSGQARFVLKSLVIEDFPKLPSGGDEAATAIPAQAFAWTVERVARAASRDETRPVLTGILVSVGDTELQMVATDSYRLSVKATELAEGPSGKFEANVPARALQEVSRIVRDTEAKDVTASARDNQIVFGVDGVLLSSRTIEGQFPNYQQLLPESYEHELRLSKSEFLAVVRRVSLMAQRNAPLKLRFQKGSVEVSAQTADVGEASESIPVDYGGDDLEIGFNPQFLQDGLESVDGEELVLKLISPLRPGLLEAEPTEEEKREKGRFLYLIMPVRLNV